MGLGRCATAPGFRFGGVGLTLTHQLRALKILPAHSFVPQHALATAAWAELCAARAVGYMRGLGGSPRVRPPAGPATPFDE